MDASEIQISDGIEREIVPFAVFEKRADGDGYGGLVWEWEESELVTVVDFISNKTVVDVYFVL